MNVKYKKYKIGKKQGREIVKKARRFNADCRNTDREIWRRRPGDYYSPSIHVTQYGDIAINVGGHVLVASVEAWHDAGNKFFTINLKRKKWRRNVAYWLLGWKKKREEG